MKKIHLKRFSDKDVKTSLEADRVFKRPKRGLDTGFPNVDENFTSKKGEHCVVYGSPNSGKTTFVYATIVNQAKNDGNISLIWSPEEFTVQHVYKKLAFIYMGKHYETLNDTEQMQCEAFLNTHFIVMDTPRLEMYWETLEDAVNQVFIDVKFDSFVVDHAMMIEKDSGDVHEMHVRKLMNKLIDLSQKLNIFIWIVNHVQKPTQYKDPKSNITYIPPQDPTQMAYGQMWYRLCFNCIEIFRPMPSVYNSDVNEVWVNVRKVKNPDVGYASQVGHLKLYYETDKQQYSTVPTEISNPWE